MKKLLLFGIVSILLMGNLKSAMAKGWEVFNPLYPGPTKSSTCLTFTDHLFQVTWGCLGEPELQGACGTKVFTVTGGSKYRATLVLLENVWARVMIYAPGCTTISSSNNTTVIEWVSGPCTLIGSGYSALWQVGYCHYNLTFERYVN